MDPLSDELRAAVDNLSIGNWYQQGTYRFIVKIQIFFQAEFQVVAQVILI